MQKILANDVKKGSKVELEDGFVVTVTDELKGMIRSIQTPVMGQSKMTEGTSSYIFDWKYLIEESGEKKKIELTDKQKDQANRIKGYRRFLVG